MSKSLNNEKGRCQGSARLSIKPVKAVLELGAVQDVMNVVLNAAHHANRHGSLDDFIAVALPTMRQEYNGMISGHEVELFGSETSLSTFLALEGPQKLVRRGMLRAPEIDEAYFDSGTQGVAYVRDRLCEKNTAGWLRRAKARAERRGKPWNSNTKTRPQDRSVVALHYGTKVLHVKQVSSFVSDEPLLVSTYGFSSVAARGGAVLPVVPYHAVELAHAI